MNEKLVQTIMQSMESKSSAELQTALQSGDHDEYSAEAFEAMRRLLAQRGESSGPGADDTMDATATARSVSGTAAALQSRYRAGYSVAAMMKAAATLLVVLNLAFGGWMFAGASNGKVGMTMLGAGIVGAVVAYLVFGGMAALLRAVLDTAVSQVPGLTDAERLQIILGEK